MKNSPSNPEIESCLRLQYDAFIEILKIANQLDTDIIETERSILECGLKPFDFGSAASKLERAIESAERLRSELCKYKGHEESQPPIHASIDYLAHLISAGSAMTDLARKLEGKSKGEKFGFFQYRKTLKAYEKLEKERSIAAFKLEKIQHQRW